MIETKGRFLLQDFEQVSRQLSEVELKLKDSTIINDFPEQDEGKFHHLLTTFRPILDKVTGNTIKETQQLGRKLRDVTLDGDEETVMSILPDSGQIEFSELRPKVNLSEEALWKALRGLYTKRRIRLPIETIRYE
jgi:hypothetical protein